MCPANQDDGTNPNPLALREGSLLQLDPRLRVARLSLPAWQKTIARALQRYGMYLVDDGDALGIVGENTLNRDPSAWGRVGLQGDYAQFSPRFPWHRMRLLRARRPWCGAP